MSAIPGDEDETQNYQLFCLGDVEAATYEIRRQINQTSNCLGSPRTALRRQRKKLPGKSLSSVNVDFNINNLATTEAEAAGRDLSAKIIEPVELDFSSLKGPDATTPWQKNLRR